MNENFGDATTHLLHDGQHPRLVVVVAVGPDAEVDLLWVGIRLVGRSKLEDAVAARERASLGVMLQGAYLSGGAGGTLSHVSLCGRMSRDGQFSKAMRRTCSHTLLRMRMDMLRDLFQSTGHVSQLRIEERKGACTKSGDQVKEKVFGQHVISFRFEGVPRVLPLD
jgi:hypothetical protein